ncbi:MAG: hypothetical protein JWR68_2804 [Polaromonas sp.]|nr:hypothetical protein [Polaromonas sp.]
MQLNTQPVSKPGKTEKSASHASAALVHDLDDQCLRILRCTAHAMASTPGGLRFKPGTRPWLEGIPLSLSMSSRRGVQPKAAGNAAAAH